MKKLQSLILFIIFGTISIYAQENKKDSAESCITTWLKHLDTLPQKEAIGQIDRWVDRISRNSICLQETWKRAKNLWYERDSHFRNDPLFFVLTEKLIKTDSMDYASRAQAEYLYKMIVNNRQGYPASNFSYTPIGTNDVESLYTLPDRYIILYFYDPNCDECRQTSRTMEQDPMLKEKVAKGEWIILAVTESVYDLNEQRHLPQEWIEAFDPYGSISPNALYDISRYPSLYLLSPDKKIVLRDSSWQTIANYLHTL